VTNSLAHDVVAGACKKRMITSEYRGVSGNYAYHRRSLRYKGWALVLQRYNSFKGATPIMAYNERLAARVRKEFATRATELEEKRMMGGLCFMVGGKMCVGIAGDRLMVRLDPAMYEAALTRPGCVPMDFTGRPMRGFVFVEPEGTKSAANLQSWIRLALEYNPRAKSSRRLKTKPNRKK